jgi:hypothetical protein
MSHPSTLCLALLAVSLGVACDKGILNGQVEANEAGTVQSESAKVRDDYRHEKQTALDSLDKSIADLESKEKVVAGKAKMDLDGTLLAIHARRDAFMKDLRAIDSTGAAEWDSTRAQLDKQWVDLKTTTDKAASAVVSAVSATYKPGEMTCEDFVALADVEKPKIVYWAEGFDKNGKPIDSVLDVTATDTLVPVLVSECKKTPKESLTKAIQEHPLAAPKATASGPKPTRMTCNEFVSLANVTQPKVVYWAEGFNKDGGVSDSVVDIEETDRLVPILIQECKNEPKLTFWQKIKKFF